MGIVFHSKASKGLVISRGWERTSKHKVGGVYDKKTGKQAE